MEIYIDINLSSKAYKIPNNKMWVSKTAVRDGVGVRRFEGFLFPSIVIELQVIFTRLGSGLPAILEVVSTLT